MIRHLVPGMLIGAFIGILGAHGVASASSLHVDGGVLQTWELPVPVPIPAEQPEPPTAPVDDGDVPSDPAEQPEPPTAPVDDGDVPSDPAEQPEPTDPADETP